MLALLFAMLVHGIYGTFHPERQNQYLHPFHHHFFYYIDIIYGYGYRYRYVPKLSGITNKIGMNI